MRFSFLEFKKFHGRPVSIFAESKISRSVRIPQQEAAVSKRSCAALRRLAVGVWTAVQVGSILRRAA